MELVINGSCACGEIALQLTPPTLFASYCHCESCRKSHAAHAVAWTAVTPDQLAVSGSAQSFESSEGVRRFFCGDCGTPVLFLADVSPDVAYVPVAILDNMDRPVDSHVSYEESPRWANGYAGLPCFVGKTDQLMDLK